MKKVNVSEFRDATDHLNQLDKDYHACVGVSEAFYWVESAERMLRVYLDIECSRANDEDRAKYSRAATKLFNRIESQLVVVKVSVDKAISDGILINKEKCGIILSTLDKISSRMGDNKAKVESKLEIQKTPEAIKKVNVSQFRGATEHLYRLDTNFHACANVSEKFYWLESAERMLREYLNIDCSRAKDDDRIEYKKATTKLFSRIEEESVSVKSAVDNSIANGLLQDKEKTQIILSTLEGISKRLDENKGKIESFTIQPKVENRECDVGMGM